MPAQVPFLSTISAAAWVGVRRSSGAEVVQQCAGVIDTWGGPLLVASALLAEPAPEMTVPVRLRMRSGETWVVLVRWLESASLWALRNPFAPSDTIAQSLERIIHREPVARAERQLPLPASKVSIALLARSMSSACLA
jgi:hypothetical protein